MTMTRAKLPPSTWTGGPVTLHNAVASFAQPTAAGGGGDVSGWRDAAGFGPMTVDISVRGTQACVMDGPLGIYGEKDNGEVGFIGYLNGGEAIRIQSAAVGFNQQVAVGGIFKYLRIGGVSATVTPSPATSITVKATPVLVMDF